MGESRERTTAVRKGMALPTRQFKGCLASKISPPDYQYCLENYDENPLYEKMKLVPASLKTQVYDKTADRALRDALEPSVQKINPLSYLPTGYRKFIDQNPEEFAEYLGDLKAQRRITRAVLRSMNKRQLDRLNTYLEENRNIDLSNFGEIIGRGERHGGVNFYDDDSSSYTTDDVQNYLDNRLSEG